MRWSKAAKGLIGVISLALGIFMLWWYWYSKNDVYDWLTSLYLLIMTGSGIGGCLLISSALRHTKSQ